MRTPFFMLAMLLLLPWPAFAGATIEQVRAHVTEAELLRCAEFAPAHLAAGKRQLNEALELLAGEESDEAPALLDAALASLEAAIATTHTMTLVEPFAALSAMRDRLQLGGVEGLRPELLAQAEKLFGDVVEQVEASHLELAARRIDNAMFAYRQLARTAARDHYVHPINQRIADARRAQALKYAPLALARASERAHRLEELLRDHPEDSAQLHDLSARGVADADWAVRIATLGLELERKPAQLEALLDEQLARRRLLSDPLMVHLDQAESPEMQVEQLYQAIVLLKRNGRAQLEDAEAQIRQLEIKLAKYEKELTSLNAGRRQQQVQRETADRLAELSRFADPQHVAVSLSQQGDVILRLTGLNFRSGSAVLPPESFATLDRVAQAIELFADRRVTIEGHTDSMGNDDSNRILSERRANAVFEHLRQRIEKRPVSMTAVGRGESRPIASNETAADRERNRRIEVILSPVAER